MADWKNLKRLLSLQDRISWLFSEENMDIISKIEGIEDSNFTPTDIAESKDSIYIYMEIPGIDFNDISVFYDRGNIIIKGSKKAKPLKENEKVIRIERYYGNFERHFGIKCEIDDKSIKAHIEDGILVVSMKKTISKQNINIET